MSNPNLQPTIDVWGERTDPTYGRLTPLSWGEYEQHGFFLPLPGQELSWPRVYKDAAGQLYMKRRGAAPPYYVPPRASEFTPLSGGGTRTSPRP